MTKTALDEAQRLLAEHRVRIDKIDTQLVELLNQRAAAAQEIGRVKQSAAMPVYEPKREDDVFHNVLAANTGPLSGDALKRVFERIIDEMRSIQNRDRAPSGPGADTPSQQNRDRQGAERGNT
jgi:chorismate mutase-like protein